MKRRAGTGFFIVLMVWAMAVIIYHVEPVIVGRFVAEQFFKNMANGNYSAASKYIVSKE
ncbi:hypothetical protein LJK88_31615 [Paenibacillus sp. P26]|nr:hypothetical protein LJK88_31615 [Paenibacillus sp. P26]UUZ94245.1 hypothetical protein LJK87_06470 [Paenibacillus sp. P25]